MPVLYLMIIAAEGDRRYITRAKSNQGEVMVKPYYQGSLDDDSPKEVLRLRAKA